MTREQAEALWKELGWDKVPPSLVTAAMVFYHRGYREGVDDMTEKVISMNRRKGDQHDRE